MKAIIIIFLALVILTSCGQKVETPEAADTGDSLLVLLTSSQFDAANIRLGKAGSRSVSENISVSGQLEVPPLNLVSISAPMGGFVKSTNLLPGMKVKKGSILAVLENQHYIQLQQDYLESQSKLEYLEAEYNRQLELAKENVNAQKTVQQSKSQYETMKAIVNGLEAKLAMIKISPDDLNKHGIRSFINIYSPISGYVTTVNVTIGQYVNDTDVLFKIVNPDHIHAVLNVYEKDINKVAVDQNVIIHLAGDTKNRRATVYLTGKEIREDRTIEVHCHLADKDTGLIPGMFLMAEIETQSKVATVIPNEAIVNYEGENLVFVAKENNQFLAVPVKTGLVSGEFTEVQFPEGHNSERKIVTSGAFELIGVLKNKQD